MPLNPRITDWPAGRLAGRRVHRHRPRHRERLHALGARVVVSARSAPGARRFVAEHPGSRRLPLDATDRAAMRPPRRIVERHGRIDLAMYCAGTTSRCAPPPSTSTTGAAPRAGQLRRRAVHAGRRAAQLLRRPRRRGGHLSLVSSVAGYRGLPKRWPTGRPRRR
jgi:NAD(P)-dependent dehydrogenase (short-subunit alcohol dehydrogenase family)